MISQKSLAKARVLIFVGDVLFLVHNELTAGISGRPIYLIFFLCVAVPSFLHAVNSVRPKKNLYLLVRKRRVD